VIFTRRILDAPSLDLLHVDAEVRTPHLRIAVRSGHNVTTDYALVGRSVPFAHRMSRPQISVLFAGDGRLDECGRRVWMNAGELVVSDGGGRRGGSMAYTGRSFRQLLVEWEPAVFGAPHDRDLTMGDLSEADLARLEVAGERAVTEATAAVGIREVLALLRAAGLPFDHVEVPYEPSPLGTLNAAIATAISSLERSPSIDDIATQLGWNERRVHRAIKALTQHYAIPWTEWRSALHCFRLLNATRLLAAPRATTESVSRLTGFRSPTSLCHAFDKAGLPSPGALTRAAKTAVLDAWASPSLG
jgi:AraC-like DNA-binding protein